MCICVYVEQKGWWEEEEIALLQFKGELFFVRNEQKTLIDINFLWRKKYK